MGQPMIRRIAIDNYRCFSNFEFEPGRVNLLVGANGAGKSSFVDLLTSIVDLVRQGANVDELFPRETLTRWDTRRIQCFELQVEGNGGVYDYQLAVRHSAERSLIDEEVVKRDGKTLFRFASGAVHLHSNDGSEGTTFPVRGTQSFLAQIEEREETIDLMWFLDFLDGLWSLRLDARHIEGTTHREEATLGRYGENFASWYRHLSQEQPELLPRLWASLRTVLPGFSKLSLPGSGARGRIRDLVVAMSTSGASYDVEFDELSDGQRALVVLYTLLEAFELKVGCLLLDEPETHVGLTEIQPWLTELDDRLQDGGQLFLVSHHPEVVDYLASCDPFLFTRDAGGPVKVRPAKFKADGGISASKQLARGLVGAG